MRFKQFLESQNQDEYAYVLTDDMVVDIIFATGYATNNLRAGTKLKMERVRSPYVHFSVEGQPGAVFEMSKTEWAENTFKGTIKEWHRKFMSDLKESTDWLHEHEEFLHHIAEEELISCKVHEVKLMSMNPLRVAFVADCNDKKRPKGYQEDLSAKINGRLSLHPKLAFVDARVYHKNIIDDNIDKTPTQHKYTHSAEQGNV